MAFNTMDVAILRLMRDRWMQIATEEPNNPYAGYMRYTLNRVLRGME